MPSVPAGGAEAAGAGPEQGHVVQEPQGLQVGLTAVFATEIKIGRKGTKWKGVCYGIEHNQSCGFVVDRLTGWCGHL